MNRDLGRRIKFDKIIKKHRSGNGCEWIEEDIDIQEGVIVGKRVVLTGQFQGRSPGGVDLFNPSIRHSVYLVSKSMNTRLIHIPVNAVRFDNNENNSWWE